MPALPQLFLYCRYQKTGDHLVEYDNGVLDSIREPGLDLGYFVQTEQARTAKLTLGMVLALRLYSTRCFDSINTPLRGALSDEEPHPFPVTLYLLTEAIKQLRAVEAQSPTAEDHVILWRGVRGVQFHRHSSWKGGCERAPMSTTSKMEVAVQYSYSQRSVLLKLDTKNFRQRGADLSFISAFPDEAEGARAYLTSTATTLACTPLAL